jgi:hypothetical protein
MKNEMVASKESLTQPQLIHDYLLLINALCHLFFKNPLFHYYHLVVSTFSSANNHIKSQCKFKKEIKVNCSIEFKRNNKSSFKALIHICQKKVLS